MLNRRDIPGAYNKGREAAPRGVESCALLVSLADVDIGDDSPKAGMEADGSEGLCAEFRTPRERRVRNVGRDPLEALELELESESSFGGVAGVMVVIVVVVVDVLRLATEEADRDERVGRGQEGEDVRLGLPEELLRGMRGRGELAVLELSENRFSCDWFILCDCTVIVAIIETVKSMVSFLRWTSRALS